MSLETGLRATAPIRERAIHTQPGRGAQIQQFRPQEYPIQPSGGELPLVSTHKELLPSHPNVNPEEHLISDAQEGFLRREKPHAVQTALQSTPLTPDVLPLGQEAAITSTIPPLAPEIVTSEEKKGKLKKIGAFIGKKWQQIKEYSVKKAKAIYAHIEENQDKNIQQKLEHPQDHKREINMELQYAFLNATGRRLISRALINLKNVTQFIGLVTDKALIPVNKLGPIPIFLNSLMIAVVFNATNGIQAISEKRYKKALYELFILIPLSIIVPEGFIDNSFWQEFTVFKPLEYRKNKKVVEHVNQIVESPNVSEQQNKAFYEQKLQQMVDKKYSRKGFFHLFKRTDEEKYGKMHKDMKKQQKLATQRLEKAQRKITGAERRIAKSIEFNRHSEANSIFKKNHFKRIRKFGRQLLSALPIVVNHALELYHKERKNFFTYKSEIIAVLQDIIKDKHNEPQAE